MGIYTEYLQQFSSGNFDELAAERKKQLRRISALRGRDILVFAADINKSVPQISIDYSDLLPFTDELSNLKGKTLDLILETPGGSGEVAEDLVKAMRAKYEDIAVIVPGYAKSAGTLIAMAGDEIVMGPHSAVGPIDAQIFYQGKRFSADALLEGMEKIKKEVADTGTLNRAYIPILQGISPGELQNAENALSFAKILVTQWLTHYKFRTWANHSSTGQPVTDAEKKQRAEEIAEQLCNHRYWKTHARSIKIEDLEAMRLKITNYANTPDLEDAILRYYTLLQMTFATNLYKIFETADSQVMRFLAPQLPPPLGPGMGLPAAGSAIVFDFQCNKCNGTTKMQANLVKGTPLQMGCVEFPSDNKFRCPKCGTEHNLVDARRQIEAQFKKPIVS
jgi:ATP-dependent protease ClpP protease subunit